jgi:archaellum component FlaC
MATKKQMTETIQRVDIIEDNMLKIEDNLGLLKEMIMMQNKHIESMMHLILKNCEENKQVENKQVEDKIDNKYLEKIKDLNENLVIESEKNKKNHVLNRVNARTII